MNCSANTRSHLRIYHSDHIPAIANASLSSTIFPLPSPGPTRVSVAVRRNAAADKGSVGLVAGRLYNDAELQTPPPVAAPGQGGEPSSEESGDDVRVMGEIRRQRKKEQEELDLLSPALILIHVYPTGNTFLEALSPPTPTAPTVSISITRLPHGKTSAPPTRIPFMVPPSERLEHFLVVLDSDYLISIVNGNHSYRLLYQTVEMSVAVPSTLEDSAVEIFCTSREYVGDGEERAGGEEVEGGLATPPQGKEVTRVLDTPHGMAWLNQKGKGDETLQSVYDLTRPEVPEFTGTEPLPTARRLFTVRAKANKQEENEIVLATDDEEENLVATAPVDLSSLSKSNSTTTSAPVSFIGTLPPSSGVPYRENSPSDIFPEFLVADPTPPGDRKSCEPGINEKEQSGNAIASDDIPDSLPEAFHVVKEVKKLKYAPPGLKTYTHRRTKHIADERPSTTDGGEEGEQVGSKDEKQEQIQCPELSQIRDRTHSGEDAIEVQESSQLELDKAVEKLREVVGKMDVDEKGGDAGEANSPTIKSRKPRLKRVRKEVAVEITPYNGSRQGISEFLVEEAADLEDEDIAVGETKSGKGKKRGGSTKKEYRKPPRKRARKEENIKEGLDEAQTQDKGGNTQYTFHGSSDEAEAEPSLPPPPKTPKTPKVPKTPARASAKRGKKLTSTANLTTSPATPSAGASSMSPRTTKYYEGPPPKIVFSNSSFPEKRDAATILRSLGMKKAQKVTDKDVTHLVVGNGGLVRSSKLALALAIGIPIVTDTWLLESYHSLGNSQQMGLLDSSPYIPHDPTSESTWRFSLPDAITRGASGHLATLLAPYNVIYLTPTLLTQLKSSEQEAGFLAILKATGAGAVVRRSPKSSTEEELAGLGEGGSVGEGLVFGGEKEKPVELERLTESGWGVYRVEMLTMSILRGTLETGDEFKLVADHVQEGGVEGGEGEGEGEGGGGGSGSGSWSGNGGIGGIEATPAKGRSSGRRKRGR